MGKYISILRGINVSGQKKILMADLKALYEALKFKDIITYIQSGNVIFDSISQDKAHIKATIESAIAENYNFQVPVDVRTLSEYEVILENFPFKDITLEEDGSKALITFLSHRPTAENFTQAQKYAASSERMECHDRVIYLHCPDGYGKSKLSNLFLEKKLGVMATTRNWKSVSKLYELAKV